MPMHEVRNLPAYSQTHTLFPCAKYATGMTIEMHNKFEKLDDIH
jgi:hypothetical protein